MCEAAFPSSREVSVLNRRLLMTTVVTSVSPVSVMCIAGSRDLPPCTQSAAAGAMSCRVTCPPLYNQLTGSGTYLWVSWFCLDWTGFVSDELPFYPLCPWLHSRQFCSVRQSMFPFLLAHMNHQRPLSCQSPQCPLMMMIMWFLDSPTRLLHARTDCQRHRNI